MKEHGRNSDMRREERQISKFYGICCMKDENENDPNGYIVRN